MLAELRRDLGFALRGLARRPKVAITAIATLAFSVAGLAATYALLNGVILQPPPYPNHDRIVDLASSELRASNLNRWKNELRSIEALAIYGLDRANVTTDAQPVSVSTMAVSEEFFPILGTVPEAGWLFRTEDFAPGAGEVVLVTHRFWNRQFGEIDFSPSQTLDMDGRRVTILGVLPEDFRFRLYTQVEIWKPIPRRSTQAGMGVARLVEGASAELAEAEAETLTQRLSQDPNATARIRPIQNVILDAFSHQLWIFFGISILVVLAAAANVGSLLLAMVSYRVEELNVRRALGASRLRLVQQLLTEATLLGGLGGVAGLVIGSWGVGALAATAPGSLARLTDLFRMDLGVIAFVLGTSVLVTAAFGLIPAVLGTRAPAFNSKGTSGNGRKVGRWLGTMVTAQIAATSVILVGTGLLVKNFLILQPGDPGFDPSNKVAVSIVAPSDYDQAPERIAEYLNTLTETLRSHASRPAVAAANALPLGSGRATIPLAEVEGVSPEVPLGPTDLRIVTPGYLEFMAMPMVRGRTLESAERDEVVLPTVINESLAERYWEESDPIGRQITIDVEGRPFVSTVVGVVEDARSSGFTRAGAPEMFLSMRDLPVSDFTLVVESVSGGMGFREIQAASSRIDPAIAVQNPRTVEEIVRASVAIPRFNMSVTLALGAVSLLLAIVGIAGVLAYGVAQRTREIGIRMAIGAQEVSILRLVMGTGARWIVIGLTFGLVAAYLLSGAIGSQILDVVQARDATTLVAVALFVLAVGTISAYIPARRASRLDPMDAFRRP